MRGCFGLYAGETGGNAVSLGGPLPPLCVPAGVPYRCRDMSHGYVPRRVASAARTTTWPLRSSTAGTVAVCWSHDSDRRSARRWLTSCVSAGWASFHGRVETAADDRERREPA